MKRGQMDEEVMLIEEEEEDVEIATNQDLELVLNVVKKVILQLNVQMKINELVINVVNRVIWPKTVQMKTRALKKENHLESVTNVVKKVIWQEIAQMNR
jgi:hypothetical protein